MNRKNDLQKEKELTYYSNLINAWLITKLEKDKSQLVISAGAIGLLVTLLTTIGVQSLKLLCIYFTAILSFTICIISTIIIFSKNASYLQRIAKKCVGQSPLKYLDRIAMLSFILGICLAFAIGIMAGFQKFQDSKGYQMKQSKSKTLPKRSFLGFEDLNPQENNNSETVESDKQNNKTKVVNSKNKKVQKINNNN